MEEPTKEVTVPISTPTGRGGGVLGAKFLIQLHVDEIPQFGIFDEEEQEEEQDTEEKKEEEKIIDT